MITVKKFINTARYDRMGQYIWAVDNNGDHQMLASVRGWGGVQQYFKKKNGDIDQVAAGKFQDEIGRFVADAINEKLSDQEAAAITKGELGDFVDWVRDMNFKKYAEGWCEAGGSNGWHCTTEELIQKFRAR